MPGPFVCVVDVCCGAGGNVFVVTVASDFMTRRSGGLSLFLSPRRGKATKPTSYWFHLETRIMANRGAFCTTDLYLWALRCFDGGTEHLSSATNSLLRFADY